jgi:hypothetical protein
MLEDPFLFTATRSERPGGFRVTLIGKGGAHSALEHMKTQASSDYWKCEGDNQLLLAPDDLALRLELFTPELCAGAVLIVFASMLSHAKS